MKLRIAVASFGAAVLLAGIVLAFTAGPVFLEVAAAGAVILAGTLFEARRYRARVSRTTGWQDTPEKFIDPTTGKLTRVRFNPDTGERDYVEEGDPT